MSEPACKVAAPRLLTHELWHLGMDDERIGARSEAYALRGPGGWVLIDPLPMAPALERRVQPLAGILLTVASHQRAAWSLRRRHGIPVHAPRGSAGLQEEPDALYGQGDRLPGGLRPVHAPGPWEAHFVLIWERGAAVLLAGDLVMNLPGRGLELLPAGHAREPAALEPSARRLLALPWELLCPGHGEPTRDRPRQRLLALLRH